MSFRDYLLAGWRLCSIPPGTKGPREKGWNKAENAITNPGVGPQLAGAGLLHAYSGTCALDIDNYDVAKVWLAERGVDLDALLIEPASVQISSGRAGRGKLIYLLDLPMASIKLAPYQVPDEKTGKPKTYHGFELRCATAEGLSVQDVLPPTIHPTTGRPYEWKYGDELVGDWRSLPPIPEALLALWRGELTAQPPAAGPQAAFGAEMQEILELLAQEDPDADRDTWLNVGFAIHHETGGSQEGFRAWDQWSSQGTKYVGRLDTETRWRSFRANPNNPITLAWLRNRRLAKIEDFPLVTVPDAPTEEGDDAGLDMRPDAVMQRLVGEHVIYVKSLDLYFDKRDRHIYQSDRALRNEFTPDLPMFEREGKKGAKEFYQIDPVSWLQRSKQRRATDAHSVAMHPGEGVAFTEGGKRYANSFIATRSVCAVNPNVEALRPKPYELEAFEFLWSRMQSIEFAIWLKQFYAYALKYPGRKIRSAPLLISTTTGTGKTTLMNEIPRLLFGNVEQLTEAQVRSSFNGELLHSWWATVEEIYAGNTKAERRYTVDKLKPWITNADLPIHIKGQTPFTIANRLQLTASSNHTDALQLEDEDERRWGVCAVKEEQWKEGQALGVYRDFLHTERAPGVLKWIFQEQSLTGFNPAGRPPVTKTKTTMVAASLGPWESALIEHMAAGLAPFDRDVFTLKDVQTMVPGLSGVTAHKLAEMLKAHPIRAKMILGGHRTTRMWAWRNYEAWNRTSEKTRLAYLETGVRPAGAFSDDLPADLDSMRAEADREENPCDLV